MTRTAGSRHHAGNPAGDRVGDHRGDAANRDCTARPGHITGRERRVEEAIHNRIDAEQTIDTKVTPGVNNLRSPRMIRRAAAQGPSPANGVAMTSPQDERCSRRTTAVEPAVRAGWPCIGAPGGGVRRRAPRSFAPCARSACQALRSSPSRGGDTRPAKAVDERPSRASTSTSSPRSGSRPRFRTRSSSSTCGCTRAAQSRPAIL